MLLALEALKSRNVVRPVLAPFNDVAALARALSTKCNRPSTTFIQLIQADHHAPYSTRSELYAILLHPTFLSLMGVVGRQAGYYAAGGACTTSSSEGREAQPCRSDRMFRSPPAVLMLTHQGIACECSTRSMHIALACWSCVALRC